MPKCRRRAMHGGRMADARNDTHGVAERLIDPEKEKEQASPPAQRQRVRRSKAETALLIRDAYYNPETGYVGAQKLHRRLKKDGVTMREVKEFLGNQEVVQVNRKQTDTGSFVPMYPLQQIQIDLIFIKNQQLNNATYAMTAIDVFSKKATVALMARKDAPSDLKALKTVLERLGTPDQIMTDEGSEFNNNLVRDYLKEKKVELILTLNHAPFVERFNRTLKEMLDKHLQTTKTKTITNVLPQVVRNYNSSYHRAIGMAPNEVTEETEREAWMRMDDRARKRHRMRVNVGDKVRVLLKKKAFAKGFKPQWTDAIHTVEKKEGRYFHVDGMPRRYLRAALQKVGASVDAPKIEADLTGTLEGRLKQMGQRLPRDRTTHRAKEVELAGIPDALPDDPRLKVPTALSTRAQKKKAQEKKARPAPDYGKVGRQNILTGKRRRG